MNTEGLMFGTFSVKLVVIRFKTDCNAFNFKSLIQKLLYGNSCISGFAYWKILEINYCLKIYGLPFIHLKLISK